MSVTQLEERERISGEECLNQIHEQRFPNGEFKCPRCGHCKGYYIKSRGVTQCANKKCKLQTSATSGTRFHGMHKESLPIAFDFIRNAHHGTPESALSIARGHSKRYETVWRIGHKIRDVMHASILHYNQFSIYYKLLESAFTKRSKESMEELLAEYYAQKAEVQSELEVELVASASDATGSARLIAQPDRTEFADNEQIAKMNNVQTTLAVTTDIIDTDPIPTERSQQSAVQSRENLPEQHITSIQILYENNPPKRTLSPLFVCQIAQQMVNLFNEIFTGVSFKYGQAYVAEYAASQLCKIGFCQLLVACVNAKPWFRISSYRSPPDMKAATS